MLEPVTLSVIYQSEDGAVLHHYKLVGVDGAAMNEIRRLLGPPAAEQVLTAAEVAEHYATLRGAVIFAEDEG